MKAVEQLANKRTLAQGRRKDFCRLLARHLALDFADIDEALTSQRPTDFLASYVNLPRWCEHSRALRLEDVDRLIRIETKQPSQADASLDRALRRRPAADGKFRGIARLEQLLRRDLSLIQSDEVEGLANARRTKTDLVVRVVGRPTE